MVFLYKLEYRQGFQMVEAISYKTMIVDTIGNLSKAWSWLITEIMKCGMSLEDLILKALRKNPPGSKWHRPNSKRGPKIFLEMEVDPTALPCRCGAAGLSGGTLHIYYSRRKDDSPLVHYNQLNGKDGFVRHGPCGQVVVEQIDLSQFQPITRGRRWSARAWLGGFDVFGLPDE